MRKNRNVLYAALAAALIMTAPAVAQARPSGHGGPQYEGGRCGMAGSGYARMMQSLPPEKQQAFASAMREHAEKTRAVREQLWVKRTTLNALSGNAKTEPKELTALVGEMSALRDQLYKERQAFHAKLEKDFGVSMPYGGFPFAHGRGYGYRGGHGKSGF